jgi:hypothetical protein
MRKGGATAASPDPVADAVAETAPIS